MRYEAPESLDAAVGLLAGATGLARVLAGGTDLLVQLRAGTVEPDLVVDVKKIPELRRITPENGGFRIGAAVSGAELGDHPAIPVERHDRLPFSTRERVGPGRMQRDSVRARPVGKLGAKRLERSEDGLGVRQDGRCQLDQALEQLRLQALPRLTDDPREGGNRLERLRVDEKDLLLDAERPRRRSAEPVDHGLVLPRTAWTGRPAASQA